MTTLLSIAHDPLGKLSKETFIQSHYLKSLYDNLIIIATDNTIYDESISPIISPMQGLANARRLSIRHGLETDSAHFHYCDFDRILYWAKHYPIELANTVNLIPYYDFLIFGRTPQAFATHPELQRLTEQECNYLFNCNIDILSGSRSFNRSLAIRILDQSIANGAGVDAEWPIIAKQFHYIECNGLEYESNYFGIAKPDLEELQARMNNLNDIRKVVIENNWYGDVSANKTDAIQHLQSATEWPAIVWSFL